MNPFVLDSVLTIPYRLFPGEARPLAKLLTAELPLKLDIEVEVDACRENSDGTRTRTKVTVPNAEVRSLDRSSKDQRKAHTFIMEHIKSHAEELKINFDKFSDVQEGVQRLALMAHTVRHLETETDRQHLIQVWLHMMQQAKRQTYTRLQTLIPDFNVKDMMQDVFDLLKVAKDEKTCEQALLLLRTFVVEEQKFFRLIGIEALTDIPEDEVSAEQAPNWITNSFVHKLAKQLLSLKMTVTNSPEEKKEE